MFFNINKLKQIEPPKMILCNPNGEELFLLSSAKNVQATYNLVDISEISFTVSRRDNNGEIPYYSHLANKRKVKVQGIGEFIITNVDEQNDGFNKIKTVSLKSGEYELSYDSVYSISGTYQLYSWVKPEGTILDEILKVFPDWKVGVIDDEIFGKYRTFEIDEVNAYQWLMGDISKAFECIFVFDTVEKTISAYTVETLAEKTDIFLTYQNLLKHTDISESSEDIYTVLDVKGDDGVSINRVNPMGDSRIYNFTHYKTEEWMNKELIDALDVWEKKVEDYKEEYANTYTEYLKGGTGTTGLKVELTELENERKNWETVREVRIEQGLEHDDVDEKIAEIQVKIDAKVNEISTSENTVKSKKDRLDAIVLDCSWNTNFTESQVKTLKGFITKTAYENTAFIYTSEMEEEDKQKICEDLMSQGLEVLNTSSSSKSSFNIESINFLTLSQYNIFSEQFKLGCEITLDMGDDIIAHPVCLSIDVDYESVDSFSMTFGEDLRTRNSLATWSDLFGQVHSLSSSASGMARSALSQNYRTDQRLNSVYEGVYQNKDDIFIAHETLNGQLEITNKKVLEAEAIINANKDDWDKIKEITDDLGNVIADKVEGTLNTASTEIVNANSTVIFDDTGILARDHEYHVHATKATRISSAGIVIANSKNPDDTWNWRTAITGSGINADEINAGEINAVNIRGVEIIGSTIKGGTITAGVEISAPSIIGGSITTAELTGITINTGTLNAIEIGTSTLIGNTITGGSIIGASLDVGGSRLTADDNGVQISLGDGKFLANDDGVTIRDGAFMLDALEGKSKIVLDGNTGIKIQKKSGSSTKDVFHVNTEGDVVFDGDIVGGSININNKFKVDNVGNVATEGNVTLGGNINLAGSISWGSDNSPVQTQYSSNNSSWHDTFTDGDKYIRYSYDGGQTWTAGMKFVGTDGTNGQDGADATLPEFITETYIDATRVESPIFRGGLIEGCTLRSRGTGKSAIEVYNASSTRAGYIKYDEQGSGEDESQNRMFISTDNGYAMKIQSDADLSISAGGRIWSGSITLVSGAKIYNSNGEEYGGTATFG